MPLEKKDQDELPTRHTRTVQCNVQSHYSDYSCSGCFRQGRQLGQAPCWVEPGNETGWI